MAVVAAQTQARPYRDFLTPALHKRFNDAAAYTILLCYLISLWMGNWHHWFWSWFPIGPVGVRTLLAFIPALIVCTLRIAQYHVGQRNTEKPFETFTKYALRKSTLVTVGCYALSAWFYSELYIWTRSDKDRLGFTDQGKHYERIRLNERPLYLRYMFFVLAVVQSVVHLWYDYDRIDIPAMKPKHEQDAATITPRQIPRQALEQQKISMAKTAVSVTTGTAIVGTALYFLPILYFFTGFRYYLWDYYYIIARNFVSLSKTQTSPVGLPPFLPLVGMFVVEGTLLALLWQFTNKGFDLYMAQPPLKKDTPITNDSKDPNGSLLKGLKMKKETVKAVAFWELALITDRFPERRKTIYSELTRNKAATYIQVTDLCLAEVTFLITRISTGLDPHYRPKEEAAKHAQIQNISLVPQIAPPLSNASINRPEATPTTGMEKFGALTGDFAKSLSSPQNVQKNRELLKKSVTEGVQYLKQGVDQAEARTSGFLSNFMASPFGYPFRHSLRRTASVVITGAPYSRLSLLCNAITSLTNLTVFSIREDECGQFQNVVPRIVRVFTEALNKVDEYVAKQEVHWTDFEALARPAERRGRVAEVEEVRECLRLGLEKILRTFGEYLSGQGMSRVEIMEAKRVAANGPEMAVVR